MTLAPQAIDPPFWADSPDAATFERLQDERLARARAAIARMDSVTPSIASTLVPFDQAVLDIDSAGSQARLIENVHPDAELRAAAERVSQKAAALATELSLDRRVYAALAALDLSVEDAETRHYVERTLRDFRLAGVDKDDESRARIVRLREELVEIGQEFVRNIRSDTRSVSADLAELDGLPADFVARHPAGPDGRVTITTEYPDALPVFNYATSDALRRRLYMEFYNRAYPANVAALARMLERRHQLARELGFENWADAITADKMVETAAAISSFIERIAELSGPRAASEFEVLLARRRRAEPDASTIEPWSVTYWSEQVRRESFDFDAQSVRPYFPFRSVLQGVLGVSSRLFGVTFERVDVPVWHPTVECYEVLERGRVVARFYLDMHPRPDKFSHGAEFDIRTGVAGRHIPEAALVCNFSGGHPDDPGLLEHNDVRTLFHEFGHLLHALFGGSRRWGGIGGIRTEDDFTEVPSQLFEEWVWDPAVLATFARHVETGQPIPAEQVRQMQRASEFGKGLAVRRQMAYARLSLALHDRDPRAIDVDELVRRILTEYLPFSVAPGTHFACTFGHLSGYSAAYYTYMWSLVIAKDFFGRFRADDLLDPAVAMEYRHAVLDAGGSAPAAELVQRFLGREFGFQPYREWLERDA